MASDTKRMTRSQRIGAMGEALAAGMFPERWVVRKLERDFGIDLQVEVFHMVRASDAARTTGQHLLVQVKSTEADASTYTTGSGDRAHITVSGIDSRFLNTVVALGASTPLVLVHVNIRSLDAHWVCMNDYIDHVLRIESPGFAAGGEATVRIPVQNRLDVEDEHFWYLEVLSQRAKQYALFNLLQFLRVIGERGLERVSTADTIRLPEGLSADEIAASRDLAELERVLAQVVALDVWSLTEYGRAMFGRMTDVRAVLHAMLHGVRALRRREDAVRAMQETSGRWDGASMRDLFSTEGGLTPFAAAFAAVRRGLALIQDYGTGYEAGPRRMYLPEVEARP